MKRIDELKLASRQLGKTWSNYYALRRELEKPVVRLKLSDDGHLYIGTEDEERY